MDASHYLPFLEKNKISLGPKFKRPEKVEHGGMYAAIGSQLKADHPDLEYINGIPVLNYDQLKAAIKVIEETPTPRGLGQSAIIYGDAGIGKTSIVRQLGREKAQKLGRKFIDYKSYLDLFPTEDEAIKNLKDYYIFIDIRASALDPLTMNGIITLDQAAKKGYVTELPVGWVFLMAKSSDAAGTAFFDEINQAPIPVQNALFSVANPLERTIAGSLEIKGDWVIHSAGNYGEAYTVEQLSRALIDRLQPYYLKADYKGWKRFSDKQTFMFRGKSVPLIHPLLMDIIEADPDTFFFQDPTGADDSKRPNPRNHEAFSGNLYKIVGDAEDPFVGLSEDEIRDSIRQIQVQVAANYGEDIEKSFMMELQNMTSVDIRNILAEPLEYLQKGKTKETTFSSANIVYKRKFIQFINRFDDDFRAAEKSNDEAKLEDLAHAGFNYLIVIAELLNIGDEATASDLYQETAFKHKQDYTLMIQDLRNYAEMQVSKGNDEYEGMGDMLRQLNDEMIGFLKKQSKGVRGKKAPDEGEEGQANTQQTNRIINQGLSQPPPSIVVKLKKAIEQAVGNSQF